MYFSIVIVFFTSRLASGDFQLGTQEIRELRAGRFSSIARSASKLASTPPSSSGDGDVPAGAGGAVGSITIIIETNTSSTYISTVDGQTVAIKKAQ